MERVKDAPAVQWEPVPEEEAMYTLAGLTVCLWVRQVVKLQGILARLFFQTTGTKVAQCLLSCVFCVAG